MKNILVTGANGQLGSCIKEIVTQNPMENMQFTFVNSSELNITNSKTVTDYFQKQKFQYIINCAAYTAVDKAESEPEKAFAINALGVKNLVQEAQKQTSIFIHISTDYVFDGEKKEPYTISDIPNPMSVYGASKLQGEKVALAYAQSFVIRTSWVYSEYGNNFLKTIRRLFQEKRELSIVNDQKGKPTNALLLAQKILEIIQTENSAFGLYHYASDEAMTWYEFALKIKEEQQVTVLLKPITTEEYPTPAKRPKNSVLEVNI